MRMLRPAIPAMLLCSCCLVGAPWASTARADAIGDLSSWLECEDCGPEALAAVVALGDDAVPVLAQTVLDGPPPARLEELRLHLTGVFLAQQAAASVAAQPPAANGETATASLRGTVERYLVSQVELQRVRALQALAAISGDAARSALARVQALAREGRVGPLAARECARLAALLTPESPAGRGPHDAHAGENPIESLPRDASRRRSAKARLFP